MIIFQELSKPLPQAVFARIVGRSEGRVSQWAADGTLKAGASGLAWLQALIDRLSAEAAGRASDGPLDLAQERAALAREQRLGIEIKNAVLRGQYASIELLGEVLAAASQSVAERFDHLPAQLRRACPELPTAAIDEVMAAIASARNEWVKGTVDLVTSTVISPEDDDDEPTAADMPDEGPG
jgi:phage terminase Nu1 subunit (DNA packaging protein)